MDSTKTGEDGLQFVEQEIEFPHVESTHDEIRVLHLLPTSTAYDIRCELHVANLSAPPSYEALSYVWGEKQNPQTITVDGHPFNITRALHAALENLLPEDGRVRTLWIDAICINQGTDPGALAERAHQVDLMGRIFSSASSVTAYLGEPYHGLDIAFQYLDLAGKRPDLHVNTSHEHHLSVAGHDATSPQLQRYLIAFLEYSWWDRIWTVQEFVKARRVYFQFGRQRHLADVVRDGIESIGPRHMDSCCDNGSFQRNEPVSNISVYTAIFRFYTMTALDQDAEDILLGVAMHRPRDASDPRDKIFAFQGLFPNARGVPPVDYSLDTATVFANFTITWINTWQRLDIFSHLLFRSTPSTIPSFAVDWAQREDRRLTSSFAHRCYFQAYYLKCSGATKALWRNLGNGRAGINGFAFDVVKTVLDGFDDNLGAARLRLWLASLLDLALREALVYGEPQQIHCALLHALCNDLFCVTDSGCQRLDQNDERKIWTWWDMLFDGFISGEVHICDHIALKCKSGHWSLNEFRDVMVSMYRACVFRDFIITEKGYLGLAAKGCRRGDVVAVLGGGAMPIILRPSRSATTQSEGSDDDAHQTFEVVGEAYVHGIMDGEAFSLCGRYDKLFDDWILV